MKQNKSVYYVVDTKKNLEIAQFLNEKEAWDLWDYLGDKRRYEVIHLLEEVESVNQNPVKKEYHLEKYVYVVFEEDECGYNKFLHAFSNPEIANSYREERQAWNASQDKYGFAQVYVEQVPLD